MKKEEVIIYQAMKQFAESKSQSEQMEIFKRAIRVAFEAGVVAERERCVKVIEEYKFKLENLTDIGLAKAKATNSVYQTIVERISGKTNA